MGYPKGVPQDTPPKEPPVNATAPAATVAATDLLERAEHALLALASTWDTHRAYRLARLVQRYSDRAFAVTAPVDGLHEAHGIARRVIDYGPTAARYARSVARANGVDVTNDTWAYPIR